MGAVKKDNDLILIDRKDLIEIKSILKLLLPSEFSVSYVAKITGKSNQAVSQWLLRNAEPEVDFWKKGAKILISEKTALKYISERRG